MGVHQLQCNLEVTIEITRHWGTAVELDEDDNEQETNGGTYILHRRIRNIPTSSCMKWLWPSSTTTSFFKSVTTNTTKNYLISNTTCLSRVPLDHRHLTTTLKTMSASTNLRSESTTHTRGDGSGNCARILKTGVTATGKPPCWEYLPDIYLGGCNGTRPVRTHTNQIMELTPV